MLKDVEMPGPIPNALWFEEWDGRLSAVYERYYGTGNVANRQARARAIMRRMARGTWYCSWCADDLPVWRRADAQYCSERCRKKAARSRRAHRGVAPWEIAERLSVSLEPNSLRNAKHPASTKQRKGYTKGKRPVNTNLIIAAILPGQFYAGIPI